MCIEILGSNVTIAYCVHVGSTEEYWKRQDAAQVMALVSEKKVCYF